MICRSFHVHLLGILFIVNQSICLRITNMTAPLIQDPRKDLQIYCKFDMGGEELYAVKWYKDDHEFYRYAPSGPNNYVQYPVPGVKVDATKSNCVRESCILILKELQRPSSGAYRCEVSSEAPTFRLASQTYNITVAALPKGSPIIDNLSENYLASDLILATCTSDIGDPQPKLAWYINDKEVSSKFVKELPSKIETHENNKHLKLKNRVLQISLPLDKKQSTKQSSTKLEIQCVSSVPGINYTVASARTITITDENQLVKNQMLHWPNKSSILYFTQYLSIFSIITSIIFI